MMPYRIIILPYYMKGEKMAKRGRPYKYHEDEVRPVTISLRIPPDLAEQLKAYAAQHRQKVMEPVIRPGRADAEELSEHDLERVGLQVDQEEEQFVRAL